MASTAPATPLGALVVDDGVMMSKDSKTFHLRVILGSIHNGIVAADVKGRITCCNHKAENLFRFSCRAVVGRYIRDALKVVFDKD